MRKPLMALAIMALLVLTVLGGLLPFLQGWIFFVLALYLLATEFETGRVMVSSAPAAAGPSCRAGSPPPAPIAGRPAISASSTT